MRRSLVLSFNAVIDLEEACNWYEDQLPGLSEEFKEEIEEVTERIVEYPEAFTQVHLSIRVAWCQRFPYGVFYVVSETGVVNVLAIMHSSMDPKRYRGRIGG